MVKMFKRLKEKYYQYEFLSAYLPLRSEIGSRCDDIILGLDKDGNLSAAGGFQDTHEQFHRLLENVGRAHVDLCHHHKHGDTESQS